MADEKLNILTLAMAKKYTDNSLAGAGAVAGVPCQIQSITPITGGNRVTFLWEDNNNVSHTSTLDVMDGADGEENKIDSISVNGSPISIDENKNVDITVPSIEGLTKDADLATVAKSGNYEDLANKPEIPSIEGLAKTEDIPTKVSELTDGSDYAKKTDIPTTLPANGGNADTVNNHTVKSDVPENAVFTDTIYDDTEVKGSIEELNSNLGELSDYSTEEKVIGKWVDGRNVYRKVINFNLGETIQDNSTTKTIDNIPNISAIIDVKGYIKWTKESTTGTVSIPYTHLTGTDFDQIFTVYNHDNGDIKFSYFLKTLAFDNQDAQIVIEYIKE